MGCQGRISVLYVRALTKNCRGEEAREGANPGICQSCMGQVYQGEKPHAVLPGLASQMAC